jgi:methionyl-tRNA formyltransferase
MSGPRIVFFGYSEAGSECLDLLLARGDHVAALFTHEDAAGENIWFRAPAASARARGIPVFAPESVNTPEWRDRIASLRPDLILSVYYRHIIGTHILAMPRLGAFNIHGSLLPRYRGRAPVNWAVLHGEPRIGMTLHRMTARADAGAIVDQEGVDIGPRDTAAEAFRKVLPCATRVLARQIDALLAGRAPETPQDESLATTFGARRPEDGRIDWRRTTAQIFNLVRAVADPFPGAFTEPVPGSRLMVWWCEPAAAPRVAGAVLAAGATAAVVPGTILSAAPLVVATGDGALEITRPGWAGAAVPLRAGALLPSVAPQSAAGGTSRDTSRDDTQKHRGGPP